MGTVVEGSATPSCIPSTLVAPVEAQPSQLPPHLRAPGFAWCSRDDVILICQWWKEGGG